ncbi:MAG: YHS domain-containing (seleno)protein [Alphaproteobacteria bacterium]
MAIWRHLAWAHPARRGGIAGLRWVNLAIIMTVMLAPVAPTLAGIAQLYWTDAQTGIAIGGFDPVSYFVDGRARPGKPAFEFKWASGTWRFVNQGNREIFRRDPQIYAPQFGGYGAVQVARGFITPGNPLTWIIRKQRLYFFSTLDTRNHWPANDNWVLSKALANWPGLRHTLVK